MKSEFRYSLKKNRGQVKPSWMSLEWGTDIRNSSQEKIHSCGYFVLLLSLTKLLLTFTEFLNCKRRLHHFQTLLIVHPEHFKQHSSTYPQYIHIHFFSYLQRVKFIVMHVYSSLVFNICMDLCNQNANQNSEQFHPHGNSSCYLFVVELCPWQPLRDSSN
jgi:hypothetical protein